MKGLHSLKNERREWPGPSTEDRSRPHIDRLSRYLKLESIDRDNMVEVLLVEDSMSDAELTMRALHKNNLVNRVLHLKDGVEALDYLFSRGRHSDREPAPYPKVILLDLKMPRLDGMEVLSELKSSERTKRIPVVIFTSSGEDPDIRQCYELGANSYIVKPVEYDGFQRALSEVGLYWVLLNKPAY